MTATTVSPSPARDPGDPGLLIAEANHRIANNLSAVVSMLRLQAAAVGAKESMAGPEVREVLEEVAARIDAVAMLQRRLAAHPLQPNVALADYLREICAQLMSPLTAGQQFELIQNLAADCLVPRDSIVPVALIVNELVTNATKYAHPTGIPGKISLGCYRDAGGELVVEVADDGVGFPEGFDPKCEGNVGFRVVRALATQMEASLVFDSSSLGLSVRLVIPPRH